MFQVHQNVQSTSEQFDHHRLHFDVQQCHISGPQQSDDQRQHVPVHMRGASVVANGRVLVGVRRDVLENLEGALHIHGYHDQQKGKLSETVPNHHHPLPHRIFGEVRRLNVNEMSSEYNRKIRS